ncbi:MAG: hypothetical protein OZSIB_2896 [Candidatus Ozemobacter sibiricus]|jgi:hypothetical protein|uniref:Uncharacterized protein n=1 Tax=Candidatus Ozemobacter sibiricus TaxID=2268124 RepID=A0A367ZR41_9BACT|nr:MAG: hypothetical protein OZSIB_2896 [Candidatus Ozemobacter sibiricus]
MTSWRRRLAIASLVCLAIAGPGLTNAKAERPNPFPADLDPFAPSEASETSEASPPVQVTATAGRTPDLHASDHGPPVSLTLASCPISLALSLLVPAPSGGYLLPAPTPEPLVTLALHQRPFRLALRELAELAGLAAISESVGTISLHILTRPQTALFAPRFASPPPPTPLATRPITLVCKRADLEQVLGLLAAQVPVRIIRHPELTGTLTARLHDLPWPLVLHGVALAVSGECGYATAAVYLAPRGRLADILPPPTPHSPAPGMASEPLSASTSASAHPSASMVSSASTATPGPTATGRLATEPARPASLATDQPTTEQPVPASSSCSETASSSLTDRSADR